jgi:hypothetical protein
LLGRNSSFALKLSVSLLVAGSFSPMLFGAAAIPACGTASLASYISNTANPPASGGCAIGILDYYNFSYVPSSNAPLSSAINVMAESGGFSFGPITAAPGQTVHFEIDYDIFIDPAPVITGDDLRLDVAGDITITEFFCNDTRYIGGGLCLGSRPAQSLTVGNGNGLPNSASIVFNPPATTSQEVGIVFNLVGGATGASFDGLDSISLVSIPEPASAGCALFGLLALAGGYKLRKRRSL